jgi:threonyl-tRNA synthetase
MFPPMKVGGEELVLRPANCPSHIQVYASRAWSWRELPVGLAEAGTMFRNEQSGALAGLSRVRQISLGDAHVFCRDDQVDHVLPERFNLSYITEDSTRLRPVMVHRGLLGSMERLVALLIELYDGRFPTWLAPVQVAVLPVSAAQDDATFALVDDLRSAGLRVQHLDRGRCEPSESLPRAYRLRTGTNSSVPTASSDPLLITFRLFFSELRASRSRRSALRA